MASRRTIFARPGSALRAATSNNPRNLPCPTCGKPNKLTPADVRRGYQCDECERVTASALAEYARVKAPALAEYERVKADTIRTLTPYPFK